MLLVMLCLFFKHKTAYEMRISDWSSDVCSSDLGQPSARRDRCNRGGRCRSLRRRAGSLATRRQPHRSRTSAAPLHAGASSRLAQAPGDRGMTRRFYLRATTFAASAFAISFAAIALTDPLPRVIWNASSSAPLGLYRIRPDSDPPVGALEIGRAHV